MKVIKKLDLQAFLCYNYYVIQKRSVNFNFIFEVYNMESQINNPKGVGIKVLLKELVKPDDEVEQETVETAMGTVWVKVWNHLDKWGKDITEKGVTWSKGKNNVRVKAIRMEENKGLENSNQIQDNSQEYRSQEEQEIGE